MRLGIFIIRANITWRVMRTKSTSLQMVPYC
ncbi:Uncharacterised protein [Vibrio cholerae]|nr:Uncharacterised protein [Vibrio cholerae]